MVVDIEHFQTADDLIRGLNAVQRTDFNAKTNPAVQHRRLQLDWRSQRVKSVFQSFRIVEIGKDTYLDIKIQRRALLRGPGGPGPDRAPPPRWVPGLMARISTRAVPLAIMSSLMAAV